MWIQSTLKHLICSLTNNRVIALGICRYDIGYNPDDFWRKNTGSAYLIWYSMKLNLFAWTSPEQWNACIRLLSPSEWYVVITRYDWYKLQRISDYMPQWHNAHSTRWKTRFSCATHFRFNKKILNLAHLIAVDYIVSHWQYLNIV